VRFENTEVWGFEHAVRGMRNPYESWKQSDSSFGVNVAGTAIPVGSGSIIRDFGNGITEYAHIGSHDMARMQVLIKSGSEHRKFMRQIFVSVDVTAPLYFWKEFDTYKVGTVSNSTSTMHKLASTPITRDCFEMDDFENVQLPEHFGDNIPEVSEGFPVKEIWDTIIATCEKLRLAYALTNDEVYWKELIRLLPESWLQKRTITMNYENVLSMVCQRKCHRLTEWSEMFIDWARTLPYADELLFLRV